MLPVWEYQTQMYTLLYMDVDVPAAVAEADPVPVAVPLVWP